MRNIPANLLLITQALLHVFHFDFNRFRADGDFMQGNQQR